MGDAVSEMAVCEKCSAEVRSGSAFCYSCGVALRAEKDVSEPVAKKNGKKRTVPADTVDAPPVPLPDTKFDAPPIPVPSLGLDEQPAKPSEITPVEPAPRKKLRTASELRRQKRPDPARVVEYRWEEPANVTIGFGLAAVILTLITIGIIVVAMYLR